jgi:hypothetical protein
LSIALFIAGNEIFAENGARGKPKRDSVGLESSGMDLGLKMVKNAPKVTFSG